MKKIFIALTTLAIVLTGCQKNEIFDNGMNSKDGVIKFGVITPKTKALPFGGTTDFLTDGQTFNVVGRLSSGTYYLGTTDTSPVEVIYNKATNEWSYPGVKFWPDYNLDFFAWKDGRTGSAKPKFSEVGSSNTMSFESYRVDPIVTNQQDLLVSADTYKKPTIVEQTVITFKHALTQVVFSAQLYTDILHPTPSISVQIDEVSIENVANSGSLIVSPFGYNDPIKGGSTMKNGSILWDNQSATNSAFSVTNLNVNITKSSTNSAGGNLISLTNNTQNAMLMIPQTFTAWDYSTKIVDGGTYIRVKALIIDSESNAVLWGTTTNGGQTYASTDLYIPVSSQTGMYGEWVWGRKINYVIVFGDPNSGSGGGGWGGEGDDPVLVPIRLDAQLTDWDTYDVYLQTVNFSGTIVNAQGLVDQFITEINNNPAKKYIANFAFADDATGLALNWNLASVGKCVAGSQITIDLTHASSQPENDNAFRPTIVLAGYSWKATKTGNLYVYVLTQD